MPGMFQIALQALEGSSEVSVRAKASNLKSADQLGLGVG